MPKIRRLDPHTASLIAAGEVIERPASVLKELLENALDSGASRVDVESVGAGQTLLRVSDNGGGMDADDLKLCVERHATSKIKLFEDLGRLDTYGFRGEALYAVAAVARLRIESALHGAKSGWQVTCSDGLIRETGPAPALGGTRIEVRELFHNTPARRKFLKSPPTEKSFLTAIIEEAALANPAVRFTYKSETRKVFDFAAQGGADALEACRKRVAAVWGKELAAGLVPAIVDRPGMRITMFLSPEEDLVASRNFQLWFVNRRPISSRLLQQALYRAYQHRPRDRHPACLAFIDVPADSFDVNVHPGKREIRFKSDREMFQLIESLAVSALAKSKLPSAVVPSASSSVQEEVPAYYLGGRAMFPQETFLPLPTRDADSFPQDGTPRWFNPPYRFLGQIEKAYLVFEASGGLFVLDQHAAAERILFEKYIDEVKEGGKAQRLMLPLPIDLPASRVQRLLGHEETLSKLGFEIAPLGKTTLHITAAPALFHKAADLKELIHRLLDSVEGSKHAAQDVASHAIATIACKAAVKAHDALGNSEALKLLEDLKNCRDGSCCPHGRRSMLALTRDELARRFERPGAPPLG